MSKKSFRAAPPRQPTYPKPADLSASSLRKLGLSTLGGLLLGGMAGPAVPQAQAGDAKDSDAAKSVRLGGKRPGPRPGAASAPVEEVKATTTKTGKEKAPRFEKTGVTLPAREPADDKEASTAVRTDTKTEKSPPAPNVVAPNKKGTATASRTGTATTKTPPPEPLPPPPGVPPMPHEIEPAPSKNTNTSTTKAPPPATDKKGK